MIHAMSCKRILSPDSGPNLVAFNALHRRRLHIIHDHCSIAAIAELSREIHEMNLVIGDFERSIQIDRFELEHNALPDFPQEIEAHVARCYKMIASWKDILAQPERVIMLLGYPRGIMKFTTFLGAHDADLSAQSALDHEFQWRRVFEQCCKQS